MIPRAPIDELDEFLNQSTDLFARAVVRIARSIIDGRYSEPMAEYELAGVIGEAMAMADLYGRRRTLLELDSLGSEAARMQATLPVVFAAKVIPQVAFQAAIDDLVSREPRLADTWQEVAEIYQTEHAFVLARASTKQITEQVQATLARLLKDGAAAARAESVIAEMTGWSRAYADTVYQTNVATAYSAGRIREGFHPAVLEAMPAWERLSANDVNVRRGRKEDHGENHKAAHGLILAKKDPDWDRFMPPSGFRCRCQVRSLSREELARRGLLTPQGDVIPYYPSGIAEFRPNPQFGHGRPDLAIYRGAA